MTHGNLLSWNENLNYGSLILMKYFTFLAVPAMAWFFFTSSYLFFRNYKPNMYKGKIIKRIQTLIIPYFLWNLLSYFSILLYQYSLNGYVSFSILGFIKAFVFTTYSGQVVTPSNSPLWYVARLFSYMIFAQIIYYICTKKKLFYITMVLLIGIIIYCNGVNNSFYLGYYSFPYWLPVFLAGSYIAIYYRDEFEKLLSKPPVENNKNYTLFTIAIFFAIYGIVSILDYYFKNDIFMYIVRLTSVPVIFLCLKSVTKLPKPRWIVVHSPFYTYCSHSIVLYFVKEGCYKYIYPHFTNILLLYFIVVIISIGIIYISEYILERFAKQGLATLIGSR